MHWFRTSLQRLRSCVVFPKCISRMIHSVRCSSARINTEEYWPSEEDVNEDRQYWKIQHCPIPECKRENFLKHNCWSLEGAKECLSYCKHHIMVSGQASHLVGPIGRKRNMNSEEAAENMTEVMVEETIDSVEDRDQYRQHIDQTGANKRHYQQDQVAAKRSRNAPKGQAKGKGKGSDLSNADLDRLADRLATRQPGPSSSSAGEDTVDDHVIVPAINARQMINDSMNSARPQAGGILSHRQLHHHVTIPMSQLVLLRDCTGRIATSNQTKLLWHVQEIRKAQAEQAVLEEALNQMDTIRRDISQL